jgi:hypothetical protein
LAKKSLGALDDFAQTGFCLQSRSIIPNDRFHSDERKKKREERVNTSDRQQRKRWKEETYLHESLDIGREDDVKLRR